MLEQVYYIGQTIAVVAILISVLAVFYQVRQANILARSELTFRTQQAMSDLTNSVLQDHEFLRIYTKGMFTDERLDEVEKAGMTIFTEAVLINLESVFFLSLRGLIDPDVRSRHAASVTWHVQQSSVARAHWNASKHARYAPEFREYLDDVLAKADNALGRRLDTRSGKNQKADIDVGSIPHDPR